ncbi:hypothetical protein PBI_GRAYSON_196 [Rhodococcus phage Grayson]|nr:hypothetical protein PBI_GRAYSON_196 [Rhodococcus phage Grayson]
MKILGDRFFPNKTEAIAIMQYIDLLMEQAKEAGYESVPFSDLERMRRDLAKML